MGRTIYWDVKYCRLSWNNRDWTMNRCQHWCMCIVENVINNRPLTAVSDDPNDLEPLTPNHLLQLRAGPTGPPGVFVKQDMYCRRRWRQVQYLADMFWKRWTKEYLPTLQRRGKWLQKKRNVQPGNILLVVDDNLPRNHWLLGRVRIVHLAQRWWPCEVVRTVQVKTQHAILLRPVHKLCMINPCTDED